MTDELLPDGQTVENFLAAEPPYLRDCAALNDPKIQELHDAVAKHYQLETTRPNSDRAIQEAKDDNLDVVFPAPNELQLDLDTPEAWAIYQTMWPIVNRYYGISAMKEQESRSGYPKRHVTLGLDRPVTNFERIAIQACLGSDRVRELLGVIQEMAGDPHPTLFLEKKPDVTLPADCQL